MYYSKFLVCLIGSSQRIRPQLGTIEDIGSDGSPWKTLLSDEMESKSDPHNGTFITGVGNLPSDCYSIL